MSQQNIIASTRRSGEAPLSRLDAKEKIRAIGKGSVIMFTRLLDITPGFYESRVAPVIRQALRQLDTDPLVGVVGEDELFEDDKKRSKLLCSIGDCPRFWHYGADEMIRRTAHIRYKIRNEQPELFGPWDRLESIKVNDEFIDIYLPNYWELERILEAMLKTERRKLLDHPNLRTTGGDLSTTARYAVPSAASQAGASPSRRAGRVTKVSKKLARSMLAVPVPNGDADDYRMYPPQGLAGGRRKGRLISRVVLLHQIEERHIPFHLRQRLPPPQGRPSARGLP
jgi:hypothetical protein